jgi:hypothetical protein
MTNRGKEKFRNNAGIKASMGNAKLVIYRLLGQNKPLARFEKAATSPSLAIFLDTMFKPEIHLELSSL